MARSMVPFAEVEAAVRAYDFGAFGRTELTEVTYRHFAAALRFDPANDPCLRTGRDQTDAWDRFKGQLKRAFDKLAAEGTLRKADRTHSPDGGDGTGWRGMVSYLTPEAWDEAAAKAIADAEAAADRRRRWEAVHDGLTGLRITPKTGRGLHVQLSLAQWEALTELARRGAAQGT